MEHLCFFFTQTVLCFHSESKLLAIKIVAATMLEIEGKRLLKDVTSS